MAPTGHSITKSEMVAITASAEKSMTKNGTSEIVPVLIIVVQEQSLTWAHLISHSALVWRPAMS